MEPGELKVDDRVSHGNGKVSIEGRVLELSEDGRRALVRWDIAPAGSKGDWTNVKPLKRVPRPLLMTFCGYCLVPLGKDDDVVINTRNGVSMHMACARVIVETVRDHDENAAAKERRFGAPRPPDKTGEAATGRTQPQGEGPESKERE